MAETTPAPQGATEGQSTAPQTQATTDPKAQGASPASSEADSTANKLLAGKFKAVPDLEKSYKDLQAELNRKNAEIEKLQKGAKPAAEGEQPVTQEAPKSKETTEQKTARMGELLMQEYMEKGSLSDAAKAKAVEELGLPPAVIADFEKYLTAQKDAGLKKIKDTFADVGEFDINAVIEDMSRNVPANRLEAIQVLIDSGDIEVLRPYIKAHVAKAQSQAPNGQVGRAGATPSGAIASREQYQKAITDPRFDGDREYRAKLIKDLGSISPELQRAWAMGKDK